MKEYRIANSENKSYIIFNDYNSAHNYVMDTMLANENAYLLEETSFHSSSMRAKTASQQIVFVIIDPSTRKAMRKSMTISEADRGSAVKADWTVEWRQ